MISFLKDKDNLVYALIEWQIVDERGQFKDQGEYCYVQYVWCNDRYDFDECLKELILIMDKHPFTENVERVYWQRTKYDDRVSKSFSRKNIMRRYLCG